MTTYLRVGCCINVNSPIQRCVFIGGTSSPRKCCMFQYERIPTLCLGCGLVGHLVSSCPIIEITPDTNLQYGDWLRYLPPTTPAGSSRPQGRIHYNASNLPTPTFDAKQPDLDNIADPVHCSDEGSAANQTHPTFDLPDPLDEFLNEADNSTALDVLAPTLLMIVKPDGKTIIAESPEPRTNQTMLEVITVLNAPTQRGIKRCSPMVVASKAKMLL
ncbi:hypothetical protein V6N13_097732 [Hibiscus sabdariffa]